MPEDHRELPVGHSPRLASGAVYTIQIRPQTAFLSGQRVSGSVVHLSLQIDEAFAQSIAAAVTSRRNPGSL